MIRVPFVRIGFCSGADIWRLFARVPKLTFSLGVFLRVVAGLGYIKSSLGPTSLGILLVIKLHACLMSSVTRCFEAH